VDELTTEILNGVKLVRFTRPDIRNPLSSTVLHRLFRIINETRARPGVRAMIFTGSETVFASGANLREIAALTPETAPAFASDGQKLLNDISEMEIPTIAAINGFCYGGALDLALACAHRIASPSARFAHPGTGLGIITGWGGTQRLPRLIGQTQALEMFFTAEPVDAQRALAMGLVDEIADEPVVRALTFVDRR
jgi:enoyl-CoA hydratase/carnithine racemase